MDHWVSSKNADDWRRWKWVAEKYGMTWWAVAEQFISFVLAVERLPPLHHFDLEHFFCPVWPVSFSEIKWNDPHGLFFFFFFFSCPFLISTAQLPRNPRNALCWKLLFLYVLRNFTRQKKRTSRKWLGNWANNNSSSPSESRISNRWSWCQSSTSGLQDLRTQRQ